MQRNGSGFKASARVRMVHCAVRYGVSKSPKWEWNEWGLPITNTDLFFTTSKVFCANAVEAMERLGTRYTDQEREDIFALWRYIAYVMGVPDELNHLDRADSLYKNEIVLAVEHEPDEANRILLHSLIGFASKTTEGYQALPPWLTNRLSPEQKVVLSYGLIRYLTSDEFCDSMGVPDTKLKHLVAAAARLLAIKERVARRLPHNDRKRAVAVLGEVKAALSADARRPRRLTRRRRRRHSALRARPGDDAPLPGPLMAGRLQRLSLPQWLALVIVVQAAALAVLAVGSGAASLIHPSRGGTFIMHLNGWHLLAHVGMGASAVTALCSLPAARWWALGAGLVSLAWAAAGLLSDQRVAGLIRDDTPGSIIHAVEGFLLFTTGAVTTQMPALFIAGGTARGGE